MKEKKSTLKAKEIAWGHLEIIYGDPISESIAPFDVDEAIDIAISETRKWEANLWKEIRDKCVAKAKREGYNQAIKDITDEETFKKMQESFLFYEKLAKSIPPSSIWKCKECGKIFKTPHDVIPSLGDIKCDECLKKEKEKNK